MSKPDIIVIQGAGDGAYAEDEELANFVRDCVSGVAEVVYPQSHGLEALDWELTRSELSEILRNMGAGGQVVAHSLGGAAVLKLLAEGVDVPPIAKLFLLATPYKCKDGEWGEDAFALKNDFASGLPEIGEIHIFHGRDDDFVPVAHNVRYSEKLPQARNEIIDGQGHQFDARPFPELERELRKTNLAR